MLEVWEEGWIMTLVVGNPSSLPPLFPPSLPLPSSLPSFSKYLLSTYLVPGPVVDIGVLQSTRMS